MSELQTVSVIDPTGGDPFTITGSTTDFGVVGAIARNGGYYEPHVLRALGRVLTPESVCLDIGANIGVLSVFLSRHCPQGAVHSFEPALDNLDNLGRNLELNHTTNVSTHRIALYDSVGSAELNFTADHPGGSFISATDARGGSPETVTISTLDAWVQENDLQRLDLIKLDVEGGELRVLRGGQATLARFKPKLIVECNPIPLRRFQQATEIDLLRLLQQFYGNDISMILATGELAPLSTDRDLARELSRQGLVDLLCGTNASVAPPRRGLRARAREALTTTRAGSVVLSRAHQAGRVPLNFVHDPAFEGTFEVNRLVVRQGELFRLPVHLRNTGSSWWNSRFPQHPVTASYRWAPAASAHDRSSQPEDGIRTLFRAPVGPGQRTSLELTVKAPPAPGHYELIMTLVQESFAWFDDLDGRLQLRLPVTVEAQTA